MHMQCRHKHCGWKDSISLFTLSSCLTVFGRHDVGLGDLRLHLHQRERPGLRIGRRSPQQSVAQHAAECLRPRRVAGHARPRLGEGNVRHSGRARDGAALAGLAVGGALAGADERDHGHAMHADLLRGLRQHREPASFSPLGLSSFESKSWLCTVRCRQLPAKILPGVSVEPGGWQGGGMALHAQEQHQGEDDPGQLRCCGSVMNALCCSAPWYKQATAPFPITDTV